jgi:glyoxylase-like metal-dependent hydrolase (beta-lactamase superfamily II)
MARSGDSSAVSGQDRGMTYMGLVRPGGPADVRELAEVIVTKLAVGPMNNNCYLLRCRATGQQLLIDAAAEPERLLDLIGPDGLEAVVTTHEHADHVGALAEVVTATGATTYARQPDAGRLPVETRIVVDHGDRIAWGACALEAIALTGHTPGGVALLYDDPDGHAHVFTGDSLFPGGVGNTWDDAARFTQLLGEVEQRLFDRLSDETWIYPGHGADTTLGAERPQLPAWRARGW